MFACGSKADGAPGAPGMAAAKPHVEPGTLGAGADQLSEDVVGFAQALQGTLQDARNTTAAELESKQALAFSDALGYDPLQAEHLDLIQSSRVSLQPAELDVLAKRGFVIANRQRFPSFMYGYTTIYAEDLPVYISADSILDALHRSYDTILLSLENAALRSELDILLRRLLAKLQTTPASQTHTDLNLYLSVAQTLLQGDPMASLSSEQRDLVSAATAAMGAREVTLFGMTRVIDFSQFKPRGHYAGNPQLEGYFRAMIWLGKVDFQLVEYVDDKPVLRRAQAEATLLLHALFDDTALTSFQRIDQVVRLFVGESDNMTLQQVPALLRALGIGSAAELAALPDAEILRTILGQGFGKQSIMSHLMQGGLNGPVPLNASFLLFGQRYVIDSHVFHNVVFDRVVGLPRRMMPEPLDVAFAALGNDQAVSLLHSELTHYPYAGDLAAMRALVDQHDQAFWQANLYNDWLSALRALSPNREAVANPKAQGLPSVVGTSAWGRRVLGTQLASWAQLRHDTILYAKQSYSGGVVCEFPDAAVDPYPEFYAAVGRFAEHGYGIATLLEGTSATQLADTIRDYFMQLRDVAAQLKGIAEAQRNDTALTEAQLAFINDAVTIKRVPAGCTSIDQPSGWYARLFFEPRASLNYDPTIADVHTQPTDDVGTPVGRVLHVGTGEPRLMVVTQDSCAKPKAYVGLASSYYEHVTEKLQRLTDTEWKTKLQAGAPPEPEWIRDLVPAAH
jgi:hypothetical protein